MLFRVDLVTRRLLLLRVRMQALAVPNVWYPGPCSLEHVVRGSLLSVTG